MIFAAWAIPPDGFKLLLLAAFGGGLLALGRWSSRLATIPRGESPADSPTPDVQQLLPGGSSRAKVWPPSADEVAVSLPYDPLLCKIRIQRFFFTKADAIPGPADREVFADELNIELYDPETEHAWWQSFLVATPRRLSQILRDRSWRYLYAPEVLVFPRYDLEEIRRAVVGRILADHEFFKDMPQDEEDWF